MILKLINNMKVAKIKKMLMNAAVTKLLQANNTITTLEVKTKLREDQPEYNWVQEDISKMMAKMEKKGKLVITDDNGTYRTYSDPLKPVPAPTVDVVTSDDSDDNDIVIPKGKKISMTKARDLMLNSRGNFFTAIFTTKKGKLRQINCLCKKDQDTGLGYVQVKEASLMRKKDENPHRQINLQTLHYLKIGGVSYRVKK